MPGEGVPDSVRALLTAGTIFQVDCPLSCAGFPIGHEISVLTRLFLSVPFGSDSL